MTALSREARRNVPDMAIHRVREQTGTSLSHERIRRMLEIAYPDICAAVLWKAAGRVEPQNPSPYPTTPSGAAVFASQRLIARALRTWSADVLNAALAEQRTKENQA